MRIVFIGAGEIGVPVLRVLQKSAEHEVAAVVTQPDKPAARDQHLKPTPVKKAINGLGTPIVQPARIRDRQAVEQIRALEPEVIVVMAYGQILPRELLEVPQVACINLHASLLPRWRGAAPIQAAIVAGDRQTGITVMYMDEGLDTGDILLQRNIDIRPNDTGASLQDRLGNIAPDALLDALRLLAEGTAPRVPQNNMLATSTPKLKREHGKIDWSEPAEEIERKIRAYCPWPGTYMILDRRKLKIFSASFVPRSGN